MAMSQLPSLEETLLCSILKKLPEETAQMQSSLSQVTAKYRTDLDAQLASTLQFQNIVVRSHERLQKRLKASVRYVDEASKSLKAGVDESLSHEVKELSEQVMGKLIGIMELIGTNNIDGERWPMLKRALGQEGYEVVDSLDEQSTVTDIHGLTLDTPDEASGHETCDESSLDNNIEDRGSAFNHLLQQDRFDQSQAEFADDEQEDDDQQKISRLQYQSVDRTHEESANMEDTYEWNATEDFGNGEEGTQLHNQQDGAEEEQKLKQHEERELQDLRPEKTPEYDFNQAYNGKRSVDESRENLEDKEEYRYQEQYRGEQQGGQQEERLEKLQKENDDLLRNGAEKEENEDGTLEDDCGISQGDHILYNKSQISDSTSIQQNDLSESSTVGRDSRIQSCEQIPDSGNLTSRQSTPSLEDHDHLQSIEATINKYKTRKLRPIPLPKTSSSLSLVQSQESMSVHGLVIQSGGLSLDESLRKFT